MQGIIDEATRTKLETVIGERVAEVTDDLYFDRVIGFDYPRIDRWALGDGNKESVGRWCQPGGVGNTKPDPTAPHGAFQWIPGADIGGQLNVNPLPMIGNVREDNFYFYARLDDPQFLPSRIVDEREFLVADWGKLQGLEWQWQLQFQGKVWNGGWQLSRTSGVRVWDMVKGWVTAAIPGLTAVIPMPDMGKVVKWRAEHVLRQDVCQCVKVEVNGVELAFNYLQLPQPSGNTKFTAAVQIDPLMKVMTGKNGCAVTHKTSITGVW